MDDGDFEKCINLFSDFLQRRYHNRAAAAIGGALGRHWRCVTIWFDSTKELIQVEYSRTRRELRQPTAPSAMNEYVTVPFPWMPVTALKIKLKISDGSKDAWIHIMHVESGNVETFGGPPAVVARVAYILECFGICLELDTVSECATFLSTAMELGKSDAKKLAASDVDVPTAATSTKAAPDVIPAAEIGVGLSAVAGAAMDVMESVLEAIEEAPFVGPIAKVLLLIRRSVGAVKEFTSQREQFLKEVDMYVVSCDNIRQLYPDVEHPPGPALSNWLHQLEDDLADALKLVEKVVEMGSGKSWLSRTLDKCKSTLLHGKQLQSLRTVLHDRWHDLGTALGVENLATAKSDTEILVHQLSQIGEKLEKISSANLEEFNSIRDHVSQTAADQTAVLVQHIDAAKPQVSMKDFDGKLKEAHVKLGKLPHVFDDRDTASVDIDIPPIQLTLWQHIDDVKLLSAADDSISTGAIAEERSGASSGRDWVIGTTRSSIEALGERNTRATHVVSGDAGSGKTWLLRTIAFCHACRNIPHEKARGGVHSSLFKDFKRVIFLRLRDFPNVLENHWQRLCDQGYSIGAVAARAVCNAYDFTAEDYQLPKLSDHLFGWDSADSTLWLLDGFDEVATLANATAALAAAARVAHGIHNRKGSPTEDLGTACKYDTIAATSIGGTAKLAALLQVLISQPHVVITTRTRFQSQLGINRYIRLAPLALADVKDFVMKALSGDGDKQTRRDRLLSRMTATPALAEAMRTPVIMHMAIAAESGDETEKEEEEADPSKSLYTAIPALYQRMERTAMHHLRLKHRWDTFTTSDEWEKLKTCLMDIALNGCANNRVVLSWTSSASGLIERLAAGRVIEVLPDGRVEFMHRSLQEYYAGLRVLQLLNKKGEDSANIKMAHQALVNPSNNMLRVFVMAFARSPGIANAVVRCIFTAQESERLTLLAECINETTFARQLNIATHYQSEAAALWNSLNTSSFTNTNGAFWIVTDAVTGGAQRNKAVSVITAYAKSWNPWADANPPLAAIKVLRFLGCSHDATAQKETITALRLLHKVMFNQQVKIAATVASSVLGDTASSTSKSLLSLFETPDPLISLEAARELAVNYRDDLSVRERMNMWLMDASAGATEVCKRINKMLNTFGVRGWPADVLHSLLLSTKIDMHHRTEAARELLFTLEGVEWNYSFQPSTWWTPLHVIACVSVVNDESSIRSPSRLSTLVDKLVELGLSVNSEASDKARQTPLHIAFQIYNLEAMQILVKPGVAPASIPAIFLASEQKESFHALCQRGCLWDVLVQVYSGQFPSVGELDRSAFDSSIHGPQLIPFLMLGLPELRKLNAAGCTLGKLWAEAVARACIRVPQLQHLNLSGNNLADRGAAAIAGALSHVPQLQHLDLSGNNLADRGAAAIADALSHVPQLQYLNLSSNRLAVEGAAVIADALSHVRQLQHLNLSGNNLADRGAAVIADALSHVPQLQHLNLSSNEMNDAGAGAIAGALRHVPHLQHLDLSSNNLAVDSASTRALARAPYLRSSPYIGVYYFSFNG